MRIQTLQELGLSATEAKVYVTLLELGSSRAGELTKGSGVNRTNVYDALERLIKKGLATYAVSANRKLFEPVSPEKLKAMIKEKQERLKEILPELESRYNKSVSKENATIFKWKKGIKSIFEDILKERKDLFVYGAESRFADMFPAYQKYWNKNRKNLGIKVKIVYNIKVKARKKKEHLKLLKMKFLPEHYEFPSTTLMYGNKIVIIAWSEIPFGFMIRSAAVAKSNMNFFKILWGIAKA